VKKRTYSRNPYARESFPCPGGERYKKHPKHNVVQPARTAAQIAETRAPLPWRRRGNLIRQLEDELARFAPSLKRPAELSKANAKSSKSSEDPKTSGTQASDPQAESGSWLRQSGEPAGKNCLAPERWFGLIGWVWQSSFYFAGNPLERFLRAATRVSLALSGTINLMTWCLCPDEKTAM